MKKLGFLFLCLCLVTLSGCHRKDFSINGAIADGNGQTIYLERNTLKGVEVLDSVRLKSNGRFVFYSARPDYPDLYQLRIENRRFVFPIDSTERISIVSSSADLAEPQIISGSNNVESVGQLRRSVRNLQTLYETRSSSDISDFIDAVSQHRAYADSLIMSNTHSIVAYYALFQRVGDFYIYSPYVKQDRVYCAAVATGFKAYMPNYDRTLSLEAWVLNALREDRRTQNLQSIQDMVDQAQEPDLDVVLNDRSGVERRLSEFKGKVVVLDFSASQMQQNATYTLQLRELYNKYHSRGLEIYQISADTDEKAWLKSTENLPWICVRETSEFRSSAFVRYNVHSLPVMFILDRKGKIVARHEDFSTIEKDIIHNL